MVQIDQKELELLLDKFYNTDKKIISKNIKKYIEVSGYKFKYIADTIGVNIQTIYAWTKSSSQSISFRSATKLCNLLRISIEDLLKGE